MIRIDKKENCCGCQACADVCPKGCISFQRDAEGFLYPVVDESKCVQCGLCEKVCPVLQNQPDDQEIKGCFAAISTDEKSRSDSSSGGIFSLLAEEILHDGGLVCGVAFEDGLKTVQHVLIEHVSELNQLRGSKYLQSEENGIYRQIRDKLKSGKEVLYVGTPCQAVALRNFLGKEYSNLYIADFVCHGVPSAKVWGKYVDYREKKMKSAVKHISFRQKLFGWHQYNIRFDFANGKAFFRKHYEDAYFQLFLSDICLRPSCYQCPAKKVHRVSDITLADFWGIEVVDASMDDNKGTSLVVIHSERGQNLFDRCRNRMTLKSEDITQAVKHNSAMVTSTKMHPKRKEFFTDLDSLSFEKIIKLYTQVQPIWKTLARKVLRKIRRILHL